MSVLIKGIKMPEAGKRPFWVVVHPDGVVEYDSGDCGWQTTKACEVSTPHGRLIDADGIDRAFSDSRWEDGDWRTGKLKHWGDRPDWCLTGAEVERLITAAPTIIEAEEGEDE